MSIPPYHLRVNKAADRLAFIEMIRRLDRIEELDLSQYVYHGLGGPYLEEYRLLYEEFPDMEMVSVEQNTEILKRQRFHIPSTQIRLEEMEMDSYITAFDPKEEKSIFWLDFTNLKYSNFEQFMALLPTLNPFSILKITLQCDVKLWTDSNPDKRASKIDRFNSEFSALLPEKITSIPQRLLSFARFLQKMLQIAVEKALPPIASSSRFIPVSSFRYADSVGMLTVAGVVCEEKDEEKVAKAYSDWNLHTFDWGDPKLISLPFLSTKERLALQDLLPTDMNAGIQLSERLGYWIEDDSRKSEDALAQYATFHRYAPYLMKAIP